MMWTSALASDIARKVALQSDFVINIFNLKGIVIGSSSAEEIGSFQQAAYESIRSGREITVTEDMAKRSRGHKAGVIVPVEYSSQIFGAVGVIGPAAGIRAYIPLIKTAVESMIRIALMEQEINCSAKLKEQFLFNLLFRQSEQSKEIIKQRASFLGFDMELPRLVIVMGIFSHKSGPSSQAKGQILEQINYLLNSNSQCLISFVGEKKVIVLLPLSSPEPEELRQYIKEKCTAINDYLKTSLRLEGSFGVSSFAAETDCSYSQSYREASEALLIGQKFKDAKGIFFADDFGIEMILNGATDEIIARFSNNLQSPGAVNKNSVPTVLDYTLLQTLDALFQCNLNLSEAARTLYIHRNTLLYRLDKISRQTNRDPRIFKDAIDLKILLMLNGIRAVPPG